MNNNRLHQIEEHLDILREQQASLEREALLTTGLEKTNAELRLRLQVKPKICDYEQEYWQILAENANQLDIPESKAEEIVAEIVESVGRLEVQQDYSAEIMQVLLELRDKLNQPKTPAAIKVKWALSGIPPFVSLVTEGELDVEKFWQTNFPTFRNWSKVLAKKL